MAKPALKGDELMDGNFEEAGVPPHISSFLQSHLAKLQLALKAPRHRRRNRTLETQHRKPRNRKGKRQDENRKRADKDKLMQNSMAALVTWSFETHRQYSQSSTKTAQNTVAAAQAALEQVLPLVQLQQVCAAAAAPVDSEAGCGQLDTVEVVEQAEQPAPRTPARQIDPPRAQSPLPPGRMARSLNPREWPLFREFNV